MPRTQLSAQHYIERITLALLFVATGALTMTVFSPWRPLLDDVPDYLGRIALVALLLIAATVIRRSRCCARYAPVVYGLFVLALVVSLDLIFSIYLLKHLAVDDRVSRGWALLKLNEASVVVCSVLLFTRLSGDRLGALYLQKGDLKQGLTTGLIAFLICVAGAIPMAGLLFNAPGLTLPQVLPWLPWLLLYVLANATLEELLFRGLFLQKLEPLYGKLLSNVLIALVFTVLHKGVSYTRSELIFLAITFPLALVWGTITQRTGSLWGAILFHAGTDLPLMLGVFANLP